MVNGKAFTVALALVVVCAASLVAAAERAEVDVEAAAGVSVRHPALLEVDESQLQQQHQQTVDSRERLRSGVASATVELQGAGAGAGARDGLNVKGLIHIPLARATVRDHTTALLELQARQINMDTPSLLETAASDVPLTQEVLREKHLATYYGLVNIGESPFRILFDTGSCEFWVPSTECDMERCKKHRRYPIDEHSDSRFMARNRLNIQYLSGRVSGKMVYETVHTGDVTVNRQIVGVADHVDIVLLDDVIWDGILGLAYPNKALNAKGVVPFFDNVIKSGALKKRGLSNQFGYYIDDSRGSVTFGGVDCGLLGTPNCIKHFGFVPVSEKTYWSIRLNDVRVRYDDGREFRAGCPREGCKAIVDTGTYLLYGPGPAVRRMLRPAHFAGCGTLSRLPTFTFDFKVADDAPAVELELRPIDYVLKFENGGREDCVTGISPDRDVIWTLGQVFLRSFYTVFDRDLNRIGFARLPRTEFSAINAHADAEAQNFLETHAKSGAALDFAQLLRDGMTTEEQVVWADSNAAADADTDADADADADSDSDSEADSEESDSDAAAEEADEADADAAIDSEDAAADADADADSADQ